VLAECIRIAKHHTDGMVPGEPQLSK